PASTFGATPTTRRGLYRYVLVASKAGACDKKSNSKYPLPFDTVSVVGILKIVDCAIAVCTVTTNKRATNNPDRTLKFFTAFTRPFFLQKKTPSSTNVAVQTGRLRLQNFFAAQLRAATNLFLTQHGGGCQTNTFEACQRIYSFNPDAVGRIAFS